MTTPGLVGPNRVSTELPIVLRKIHNNMNPILSDTRGEPRHDEQM